MKTPKEMLEAKIAGLESQLDFLETEFSDLDELLKKCGFPGGVITLKETAQKMVQESKNPFDF